MQITPRRQKVARPGWSSTYEERLQSIQFALLKRQVPVLNTVVAFTALATIGAHNYERPMPAHEAWEIVCGDSAMSRQLHAVKMG